MAAAVAAERTPAALITESTLTSVAAMARGYGVPAFLVRHPFRTDRVMAELDVPLLLFHGALDRIVPVAHGRKLRAIAGDAAYVEFACGHNDFPGAGNTARYWAEIEKFLWSARITR